MKCPICGMSKPIGNEAQIEDLAKLLYGQSNWDSISRITRDAWQDKARKALNYLLVK